MKVIITAHPFCEKNNIPIKLMEQNNIDFNLSPLLVKPDEDELLKIVHDADIIIAGTEVISKKILTNSKKLKLISRTGIGYDNINIQEASSRGIAISITPNTLSDSVAEYNVGLMILLLRQAQVFNSQIRNNIWERKIGKTLSDSTIGIIGVGRIGAKIIHFLSQFGCKKILLNDQDRKVIDSNIKELKWCNKKTIYKESDIISINLPLNKKTKSMIGLKQLQLMKKDAVLINTARGGIINENDLYKVLKKGHLSGVAIDVFEKEPYDGFLKNFDRCFLTPHIASMTLGSRVETEIEATKEVIRFIKEKPLINRVSF